jgi:hypothetical protein
VTAALGATQPSARYWPAMVAAAGEAGKTLRLQLAVAVAAVGIPQANRQVLRLPVTADSQHRQGRGSTFRASPARLVPATVTSAIWVGVVAGVLPMLPLQQVAAGRCLAVAAAAQAVEQAQFLL